MSALFFFNFSKIFLSTLLIIAKCVGVCEYSLLGIFGSALLSSKIRVKLYLFFLIDKWKAVSPSFLKITI